MSPYIANQDRDLLFLDSETSGLDPLFNEAIEWAAVRTKPDGITVIESFEAKVKPVYPERMHPKAQEANGYTDAAWADAMDPITVAKTLHRMCDGVILVGQNVSFDENFLIAFLKTHDLKPSWHYHKVCTMNLAWPLIKRGTISGLSLVHLAEWAGTAQPKPHRAMTDALCAQTVYNKLMAQYVQS